MSGDLPPDVDKCSDLPDDVSMMSCPSTPGTPESIPDMPPTPPRKRARRQAAKSSPRDSSSAGKFFTPRPVGHQLALLELFSGVGALSKAARQHGWEVKEVDIVNGAEFDLTRTQLQESLLDMIRSRCFTWVHLGPPCTTFSSWYLASSHSNTRTKMNPAGLGSSPAEALGNQMAEFSVRAARVCLQTGTWFSIEQPRTSWMWILPSVKDLIAEPQVHFCHLVMCAYGSPHQKRTSFLTNAKWLMQASCQCSCKQLHVRLQGSVRDPETGAHTHRTQLAAAYPEALCHRLLSLAVLAARADLPD